MISHKKYMQIALKLAEKGKGMTSPNPMVGCVVVKRGKVVGKGYHKKAGAEHAEILALQEAGKKAKNATMYVTLEPCSHWGKTPPCTESIVESSLREVIIGMRDPNPIVNGFKELKFRGIKTKIGILEEGCKKLNTAYIKYTTNKMPYTLLKVAMSLDGRIATSTGDSKYITEVEARKYVHKLRSESDAVLVGVNTIIRDNPLLDARLVNGKEPLKVVVDSYLRIPTNANVMRIPSNLIVATTNKAPQNKIENLKKRGVNVVLTKQKQGMVDMKELMKILASMGIMKVIIEGGAEVNSTALREKIVDKVLIFTAPKIIGKGLDSIGNLGITKIKKAIQLKNPTVTRIGKDVLIEGSL